MIWPKEWLRPYSSWEEERAADHAPPGQRTPHGPRKKNPSRYPDGEVIERDDYGRAIAEWVSAHAGDECARAICALMSSSGRATSQQSYDEVVRAVGDDGLRRLIDCGLAAAYTHPRGDKLVRVHPHITYWSAHYG